VSGIESVKKTK